MLDGVPMNPLSWGYGSQYVGMGGAYAGWLETMSGPLLTGGRYIGGGMGGFTNLGWL